MHLSCIADGLMEDYIEELHLRQDQIVLKHPFESFWHLQKQLEGRPGRCCQPRK